MSPVQASCPACGGPVEFTVDSAMVTVCEYCRSVVARGDRSLEDLGKVAELADTESPLALGMTGRYEGVPFELVGRAQLGHEAGGVWDEWYAYFGDGRWGWLAEAQGRFYMTFEQPDIDTKLPGFDDLVLGLPAPHLPRFVVAEKGEARAIAAQGQIPYRLVPNATYTYADLSGKSGTFATLDYSDDEPTLYLGQEVTLDDLNIPKSARVQRERRKVEALQVNCPNCGGPMELRAPDHTERVTCPNCNGLLDVTKGNLRFLTALQKLAFEPVIPLGKKGTFHGVTYTAIGFLQRCVTVDNINYYWQEYLLYHPHEGFRWLTRSDDNWSFVESVPAGEVVRESSHAYYQGKRFKLYQDDQARVTAVLGEFYWKVAVGEKVRAADYIRPPQTLSFEESLSSGFEGEADHKPPRKSKRKQKGEIHWSLGSYLTVDEVESAFAIEGLPRPTKVAINQPFPYKPVYKLWGYFLLAAMVVAMLILMISPKRKVLERSAYFEPLKGETSRVVFFDEPVELFARRNIRVTVSAPVNNSWAFVEGDFYNEETGLVQSFAIPIEYYHGVDGGESWSEGSQTGTAYVSAVPTGKYTLRLEAQWQQSSTPLPVTIRIEQGVFRAVYFITVIGLVSVIPILVALYHWSFEANRWSDSPFSPYASSSE